MLPMEQLSLEQIYIIPGPQKDILQLRQTICEKLVKF